MTGSSPVAPRQPLYVVFRAEPPITGVSGSMFNNHGSTNHFGFSVDDFTSTEVTAILPYMPIDPAEAKAEQNGGWVAAVGHVNTKPAALKVQYTQHIKDTVPATDEQSAPLMADIERLFPQFDVIVIEATNISHTRRTAIQVDLRDFTHLAEGISVVEDIQIDFDIIAQTDDEPSQFQEDWA